MGDAVILPTIVIGVRKGDAEVEEASGGGQAKGMGIDDASALDPNIHAAYALIDGSNLLAHSIPSTTAPPFEESQ
jgi:hypothetical protein